jgi:anti-sigma-K factor RskA
MPLLHTGSLATEDFCAKYSATTILAVVVAVQLCQLKPELPLQVVLSTTGSTVTTLTL